MTKKTRDTCIDCLWGDYNPITKINYCCLCGKFLDICRCEDYEKASSIAGIIARHIACRAEDQYDMAVAKIDSKYSREEDDNP